MFNTLFSSLFGKAKEPIDDECTQKGGQDANVGHVDHDNEYSVVKVVEFNDDDGIEWLLVEKQENDNADKMSPKCLALVPWKRQDDTNIRAFNTNVNVPLMDDSWFLTPPECFISYSGHERSILLEASPFENLLIEHPSMSVYCDYKRNRSNDNDELVFIELNNQVRSYIITCSKYKTFNCMHFRNLSLLLAREIGNQRTPP